MTSAGDANGPDGSDTLSLRQAIEIANGTLAVSSLTKAQQSLVVGDPTSTASAPDTIDFDIPGPGPFTIEPATNLPTITVPVTINGYSQPGSSPNTNGPGLPDNAVIRIGLDGTLLASSVPPTGPVGLALAGGNSIVQGLAIFNFEGQIPSSQPYGFPIITGAGIFLELKGGDVVRGDFIGLNPTGNVGTILSVSGIDANVGATIGGAAPGSRNIISNNLNYGLLLAGEGSSDLVEGNFVGTDVTGTKAVPNQTGISIDNGGSDTIGGTAAGAGNVISGNTETGLEFNSESPLVEGNFVGTDVTGSTAIPNGIGIDLDANDDTIGGTAAGAGNVISGNTWIGIKADGGNHLVEGNFIGIDPTGTRAVPNGTGIELEDYSGNYFITTIGGTAAGAGNVISGNAGAGLETDAGRALVEGNFIGTDPTGTRALPNADGIDLQDGFITIGGTAAGAGNLISGNTADGLSIDSLAAELVEGNFIGTDPTGTKAVPNGTGIEFDYDSDNNFTTTIGGTAAGAGNVISGNMNYGLLLTGGGSAYVVEGNLVGTDATGTKAVPNQTGISIDNGGSNTIGGTAPGSRNVISGNTYSGLSIDSGSANLVEGNLVGTDATGTKAVPNQTGISVSNGGSDTIGGTVPGSRNLISGNEMVGLSLSGPNLAELVEGNFVGTDITGTLAIPNSMGIEITSDGSNTIGGTAPGARNLISGNIEDGLSIAFGLAIGPGPTGLVEGNYIGTDVTGTRAIPNKFGLYIITGSSYAIGGTVAGAGNVISGNAVDGLVIEFGSSVLVEGNFIGTDATGTRAIPNKFGILLTQGFIPRYFGTTIGGTVAGAGNVISGNTADGLDVEFGLGVLVKGNLIGVDATGNVPLPNAGNGISFEGGNSNTVGGTAAGAANVIAFNGKAGVDIKTAGNLFSTPAGPPGGEIVSGNSIFGNDGLGIDLGGDGVTPNNPAGDPYGPNRLQPYPVLTSASLTATGTTIAATLDAAPSASYTVEFFTNPAADPTGFGQGQTYLGSTVVTTDASGHASFSFTTAASIAGQFVSATATGPRGDTSEFAQDIRVALTPTLTTLAFGPAPTVGQPLTLTAAVARAVGVGIPAGLVIFTKDGRAIGSATLDGGGSASLIIPAPAGLHAYAVSYAGTTSDAPSASAPVVVAAVGAATTTTLSGPPAPIVGQPLTLTAAVARAVGAGAPDGQVVFIEDGRPIGTSDLDAAGTASLTIPAPAGSNTFEAVYGGSTAYTTSSSAPVVTNAVSLDTTTTLIGPSSPGTTGRPVAFAAVVAPTADGVPTGMVVFAEDGVILGQAPLDADGVAVFITDAIPSGNHAVAALYLGDPSDAPSLSNYVSASVLPPATVTTLVGPAALANAGRPLTFAAIVSPTVGDAKPTGMVIFAEDGILLGEAPLNASGLAVFITDQLSPGPHAITAAYEGDASHSASLSNAVAVGVFAPLAFGGPAVTSVEGMAPDLVTIHFNRGLNPGPAQDKTNYTIVGPGHHAITVASAVYDPKTASVTLTTLQALDPRKSYQLTINGHRGGRVVDVFGIPLNGQKDGKPGHDYVGKVAVKKAPVVKSSHPTGPKRTALARKGH